MASKLLHIRLSLLQILPCPCLPASLHQMPTFSPSPSPFPYLHPLFFLSTLFRLWAPGSEGSLSVHFNVLNSQPGTGKLRGQSPGHSPFLLSLKSPSPSTEVLRRLISLLFTFNSLHGNR